MKLSVIIPVYNERYTVSEIIERVKDVPVNKEIIVVDDGSTDGTRQILQEIFAGDKSRADERVKLILKESNQGKGAAVREGLKHSTGDVVVIQDADLEYDPKDWIAMLKSMEANNASAVYGSRILGRGARSSFAFYFGGRFLSVLTNLLYGTRITDEPTCYKMVRADVLKSMNLRCTGFEFCPEVTAMLARQGYKIYEVPVIYKPRNISEGKKIRWRDGLTAVAVLIKYRFIK